MPGRVRFVTGNLDAATIKVARGFPAKYPGRCRICKRRYYAGDQIQAKKGQKPAHFACFEWTPVTHGPLTSKDSARQQVPSGRPSPKQRHRTHSTNRQIDRNSVFNRPKS